MHTKVRQSYEPRLVTEYITQNWPGATVLYDVPLGPVPQNLAQKVGEAQAARIARTARPRADAIIVLPTEIILIEAKIMDVNQGLGMLDLYEHAIPLTPELQEYLTYDKDTKMGGYGYDPNIETLSMQKPIRKILVAANPPEWAATICPRAGIEIITFCPDWCRDYMDWRNREGTRGRRQARANRKQILEKLGFTEGAG